MPLPFVEVGLSLEFAPSPEVRTPPAAIRSMERMRWNGVGLGMSRTRLRILVLDDDRSITDLLATLLEPRFAVTVANSFDEGRTALAVGGYDVFLCDYLVEGVASAAFLASVAARHPGLRRVLMSGSPLRHWREMLERGVVVAALAKPFTLDELCAAIVPQ